jgi:phage-related protein
MHELFSWDALVGMSGTVNFRTRSAQFGNGYKQIAADGLNSEVESWPLTFGGTEEEMKPISDFLRRHKGATAFLWTPPLGTQSLWTCASLGITSPAPGLYSIAATFEEFPG